jgi:arsenical pump membrane protein
LHAPPAGIAIAITAASALVNNLPVALATGFALHAAYDPPGVVRSALIAVDLGPNCAASASLATMLWMVALRRDGIRIGALHFAKIGCAITIPALILALLLVR